MENWDFGIRGVPTQVFTVAHTPLWAPKWGTLYRTLPVTFPTAKCAQLEVFARLPLMADGLIHLDTDPEVEAISAYPMSIEYLSPLTDFKSVKKAHVPDVAVRMRGGQIIFIDYIPCNEQEANPWIERRTFALKRHCENAMGCLYVVHDERCVLANPLFQNLKVMWRHKQTAADVAGLSLVLQSLRYCQFPSTIKELRNACLVDDEVGDLIASYLNQGDDLVFAAIMQMCISGELDIDLSRIFAGTTEVRRRKLKGA